MNIQSRRMKLPFNKMGKPTGGEVCGYEEDGELRDLDMSI